MSAVKQETCEEQLRRMVRNVADEITEGKEDPSRWLERCGYDIRYLVDSSRRFLGSGCLRLYEGAVVRELVACGLTLEPCASELDACCLKLETLGQ